MSTRFRAITAATLLSGIYVLVIIGIVERLIWGAAVANTDKKYLDLSVAALLSLFVFVATLWVLFFKHKGYSFLAIGAFPAVAIFPYVLFTDRIVSLFAGLEVVPSAFVATAAFWLIMYLLLLTANVLNGAVLYNIPLGQAGKASQFVMALVASYLLLVYLFGANWGVEQRALVVGLFAFYFCYSTIWTVQIPAYQVMLSSTAITLTMILVVILLSIWPIPSIYATVIAVVVEYMLLNVAVEMRQLIGQALWWEYIGLLVLILLILAAIGEWGINGTLI